MVHWYTLSYRPRLWLALCFDKKQTWRWPLKYCYAGNLYIFLLYWFSVGRLHDWQSLSWIWVSCWEVFVQPVYLALFLKSWAPLDVMTSPTAGEERLSHAVNSRVNGRVKDLTGAFPVKTFVVSQMGSDKAHLGGLVGITFMVVQPGTWAEGISSNTLDSWECASWKEQLMGGGMGYGYLRVWSVTGKGSSLLLLLLFV